MKLQTGGGGKPKIRSSNGPYLCATLIAIFAIDWSAKQRAKHFMNDERRSMSFELDLGVGVGRDLPMADKCDADGALFFQPSAT